MNTVVGIILFSLLLWILYRFLFSKIQIAVGSKNTEVIEEVSSVVVPEGIIREGGEFKTMDQIEDECPGFGNADDSQRDYPCLIQTIRENRGSEYPVYQA